MKKIIILLILGVFCLSSGIRIMSNQPEIKDTLETAIYIDDGKLDKANEGKLVILAGRLEPELPFVDPATDVTIPYIAAYRKVDYFHYIVNTDYEYTWDPVIDEWDDEAQGVNLKEFTTSKVIAPTRLGDFNIDPRVLRDLETIKDWNDISEKDLGDKKLYIYKSRPNRVTYLGEFYVKKEIDYIYEGKKFREHTGKRRCSYQVYNDKAHLDYTIIGIQKGDWIMPAGDLGISFIKKGVHSTENFKSDNLTYNKGIGIGVTVVGIGLLCLGVYFIVKRKKRKQDA